MKSSDLTLFRDICDDIDSTLYGTLQNPDDEFKDNVENDSYFRYIKNTSIYYDFEDMQDKLGFTLRYYQRMALYFTKYYFEKHYLQKTNNNKLTYWMATGSGKTVIMKANIIDYFEYIREKNPKEIEIIITSPLKELIGQLQMEMNEFFSHQFFRDFKFSYKIETTQGLISKYENESHEIIGDDIYRLLLVDEAHIGLGTKEKGAFVNLRDALTKNSLNSFMFEYSATFYDVKNKEQIKDYAQRIIYEYDYGKFYNDRYGKDFKFDVVKKDSISEDETKEIEKNLYKNMEAFSEKLKAFQEYNIDNPYKQFPNRPLLVMAGNSVSASSEKKSDNEENSDIAKVLEFFAYPKNIKEFKNIFHKTDGTLHLLQNSTYEGEILLSYGEDTRPFGLITIGDVKKFLANTNIQKLMESGSIISKNIKFTDERYIFKSIDDESSPINILIGSRKFSAGWNSFRASQICLINFGTGSGSTIIQMFGRGVRLRGLNNDGKRQENRYVDENGCLKENFISWHKDCKTTKVKFEQLKYLETLFIFSLKNTYLKRFVDEDTDICQKSIIIKKKTSITAKHKGVDLPIFYINKDFKEIEHYLESTLDIKDNEFTIDYIVNNNKNSCTLVTPLSFDFSIERRNSLKFQDIESLLFYVDKAYIEKLIFKKMSHHNIFIANLDYENIIKWIKSKKITINYDGDLISPLQIQKMLQKIAYELISKIKNKIIYNENKQGYSFDKTIVEDDYISEYEIKFVFKQEEDDIKNIKKRLDKVDSYKIFIDSISSHYYQPLALHPDANTQNVYETYQECFNKNFTENMKSIKDSDDEYFKGIDFIKVSPDKLDPYEFKFICDMQKYILDNSLNATVLRNKASGNIGIVSEEGTFYPDFIVWYKDEEDIQHIIFCDPKGIRNSETKWKVTKAPYLIKDIENSWGKKVKLHSFIISNTKLNDVSWLQELKVNREECDKFYNLVFFEDGNYIDRIFHGLQTDIKLHEIFKQHIDIFDKQAKEEWLDDEKREKHLEIIEKIVKEDSVDISKAILLYFAIWDNKDKFKEADKKDILSSFKEYGMVELLEDFVPELVMDSLPYSRTILKIFKYFKS